MKVLIIAAHPDDEILGCGATISKHKRAGDQVKIMIITGKRGTRLDQKLDTVPILSINKKIEKVISKFKPQRVYTHYIHDLNEDHQIVSKATLVAARPQSGVSEILFFEVPSATEYAIKNFSPTYYNEITDVDLNFKISSMNKLYKSELRKWPHPRSNENIKLLAQKRGGEVMKNLAEAFQVVRIIK